MLFIDLEKNKVIKEFKFTTKEIATRIDFEAAVSESKKVFGTAFSSIISQDALAVNYILNIEDEGTATDEEANNFLCIVNVACVEFFRLITLDIPREREYRLDVPKNLKCVKTSMSLLKKAINHKTVNNIFNLTIKYKDLFFVLCDEKDIEEQEFIHSTDELEVEDNVT